MSPNDTTVGMLGNVVLFSLVFQMGVYCLLLVFFLTPHMCAQSSATQGCRTWQELTARLVVVRQPCHFHLKEERY